MAIFHLTAQIISRKDGRSATSAAAYRSGELLIDQRTGEVHDYTRKGGVIHAQVVMPKSTEWAPSRDELWNAVEAKNKRADAQVAREFVVALPDELDAEQRKQLALDFTQELADTYNIAADLCLHAPGKEGDQRNHHGHILTSTNLVTGQGFGNKQRELDLIAHGQDKTKRDKPNGIDAVRLLWEEHCNRALAQANRPERVCRLSNEALGIEEMPSIHLGPKATALKRQGVELEIEKRAGAQWAKAQAEARAELDAASAVIAALEAELAELKAATQAEASVTLQKLTVAPENAVPEPSRWERMSRIELEDQIREREADLARGIDYYVYNDKAVRDIHKKLCELNEKSKAAQEVLSKAQQWQAEWREQHTFKSKLHDFGWSRSDELAEWEALETQAARALERLQPACKAASTAHADAERNARNSVQSAFFRVQDELAELRPALENRLSQEREKESAERLEQRKRIQASLPDFGRADRTLAQERDKSKDQDYGLGL